MNKLIVTLVLCFATCTAFALPPYNGQPPTVVKLNTMALVLKTFPIADYPETLGVSLAMSRLPPGSYTYMPLSASIVGINLSGSTQNDGTGMNLEAFLASPNVPGVGWKYEPKLVGGKMVLVLHIYLHLTNGVGTESIINVAPEDIGVKEIDVAAGAISESLAQGAVDNMLNGSEITRGIGSPWIANFWFYYVSLPPLTFP